MKMTREQVEAHQRKHGFGLPPELGGPGPSAPVARVAEVEQPKRIGKRRKQMNKTEGAFAAILEAKVRAGEIVSFVYEGMTLRWGSLDNIQYTPDFVVFEGTQIIFIEAKGAHIWPQAMQKFKQARNEWPQFRFEMWQRIKGDWTQLL